MFGLFRKRSRATTAEPDYAPVVGIPVHDVTAALVVVDKLAIDRRLVRVEVVARGRLKVTTGYSIDPLNAHFHHLTLERGPGGWEVVAHEDLIS